MTPWVNNNNERTPRTGAPEAADWTEVEAEIDAAETAAAENAAAENTATENAAAENDAAESDTEMTASGTAPPMTS
jgi:FKBP-type peptidyl-prolyl cis-trans isomerase